MGVAPRADDSAGERERKELLNLRLVHLLVQCSHALRSNFHAAGSQKVLTLYLALRGLSSQGREFFQVVGICVADTTFRRCETDAAGRGCFCW